MNIHDATETAYKNGYAQGMKDAIAKNNNVGDKWTPTDDEMSANTEIFDVYIPCRTCGKLIPAGGHNHCLTCRVWQLRLEETMPKWISVEDRLPEDDLPKGSNVKQIKVLTALKSDKGVRTVRSQMRYRMTWYNSSPWAWKYSGSEITHWQYLPQPPKGE